MVVSTHLKNISQIGSFLPVGVKIKNIWNHHPDMIWHKQSSQTSESSYRLSDVKGSAVVPLKFASEWLVDGIEHVLHRQILGVVHFPSWQGKVLNQNKQWQQIISTEHAQLATGQIATGW